MKRILLFALFSMLVMTVLAFAQEVIVPPTSDEIMNWLKAIGGLKGATALAIAVFVVQGIMLFFRSQLASFAGVWQLLIVNGLTLVFGVLALKLSGVDWVSCLLSSQTLAALQVFIHQLITQIKKHPEDVKKINA